MDAGRRGIMNLTTLKDTPSWEWPEETAATLLDILRGDRSSPSDLLLAVELAGDVTVRVCVVLTKPSSSAISHRPVPAAQGIRITRPPPSRAVSGTAGLVSYARCSITP